MWSRHDLKRRAKACVRPNYWPLVLVSLIHLLLYTLITAHFELDFVGRSVSFTIAGLTIYHSNTIPAWAVYAAVASAILGPVIVLLNLLVFPSLKVGCCRFFLTNMDEKPPLSCLLQNFYTGYLNTVFIMLLRTVFCLLWGLVFLVPGIIKFYQYRLIPYLLAEYPTMHWRDAFRISRNLMRGYKRKAFVLDLSFLGWHIFTIVTLYLGGIFYAYPYRCMTNAQFYRALCLSFQQEAGSQGA